MRGMTLLALSIAGLGWSRPAAAQEFPAEEDWRPFYCFGDVMFDGRGDDPDFPGSLDLVGGDDAPAGQRAADEDFFYVRLRVDTEPLAVGEPLESVWGIAFDVDLDFTTYEVLLLADAAAGEVNLFENTVVELDDDPGDLADIPPVATLLFEDAARPLEAESDTGGDVDWFVDIAIPWADLDTVGIFPETAFHAWVASSSSPLSLDGDFACHDGAGGPPGLEESASDRVIADPDLDSDGDGYSDEEEVAGGSDPDDPDDIPDGGGDDGGSDDGGDGGPGEPELQGGGGCAASGGATSPLIAIVALLAFLLFRAARASLLVRRAMRVAATRTGPRSRP